MISFHIDLKKVFAQYNFENLIKCFNYLRAFESFRRIINDVDFFQTQIFFEIIIKKVIIIIAINRI